MPQINQLLAFLRTIEGVEEILNILGEARPYLMGILIVFALINCFFGYPLRKLWNVLLGLALGAFVGLLISADLNMSDTVINISMAAGALFFALAAYFLYKIGVFFLIMGLVTGALYSQLKPSDNFSWMLTIAFALIIAVLSFSIEKINVILVTSSCGAVLTLYSIQQLVTVKDERVVYASMGLLFLLGFLTQAQPGGERSLFKDITGEYVKKKRRSSDEEEEEDPEDSTYDFQFVPEEEEAEGTSRKKRKAAEPVQKPAVPSYESPFGPDLSDARDIISRDIQEFYEESQKESQELDSEMFQ